MTRRFLLTAGAVCLVLSALPLLLRDRSGPVLPEDSFENLVSLPYLTWTPVSEDAREKKGVTIFDQSRASRGVNLYNSRNTSQASLMDMTGRKLHTWSFGDCNWIMGEVDDVGNLYSICLNQRMFKLDWDSRLLWEKEINTHHELALADNGDILTMVNQKREVQKSGGPVLILDNEIQRLSPDGEVLRRVALYDLFEGDLSDTRIRAIRRYLKTNPMSVDTPTGRTISTVLDLFHANSIEVIDRDIPGFARKGNLLVSVRERDTIMAVDMEAEKIVWQWGPGVIHKQHDARLLKNGHILLFDNLGMKDYSRVVEMDPVAREIVRVYDHASGSRFYTKTRGASQKLPNGNILITESNTGRGIEITDSGEIVWEFWNPVLRQGGKKRAVLYRLRRLDKAKLARLPFEPAIRQHLIENEYLEEPAS